MTVDTHTTGTRAPEIPTMTTLRFTITSSLIWNSIRVISIVGCLTIHDACRHGNIEFVTTFLAECPSQLDFQDIWGNTPLHYAAKSGHLELVNRLVESGVHLHLKNNTGMTPLHLACGIGHLEVVNRLLKSGVDLNVKDEDGWAPIHYVCR